MNYVMSAFYSISIDGVELDLRRKRCITGLTIEELCDGSNSCTLSIEDPDYAFIDDNIFVEDNKVSVTLGFVGDLNRVEFSGYISAIDLSFPSTGFPSLSILCIDGGHVMNRVKKKRSWSNVTKAQVVQKIATEYGFKCEIEAGYSGKKEDTISQSSQTDLAFIENLASQEHELFMCKLVGNVVIYKKKGLLAPPKLSVQYRKYPYTVTSFSPRINKETMQDESSASNIATDTKKVDSSKSTGTGTTQGEKVKSNAGSSGLKYDPSTQKWSSVNTNPSTPKSDFSHGRKEIM